jgi:hypothetical protein
MVLESGYRIITAPDTSVKNRAVEDVTFRFPVLTAALITDKNRADLTGKLGASPGVTGTN